MSEFRCRAVRPKESSWTVIKAATPAEAAQTFHDVHEWTIDQAVFREEINGKRFQVKFVAVEVDDHGVFYSRMFHHGLWRRGGVRVGGQKSRMERLKELAAQLDWKREPSDLLAPGWEGEDPEEFLDR